MGIKLTNDQLSLVKSMEQYGEAFANQIYYIMQNHGLDKIEGFEFEVIVNPFADYTTREIRLGKKIDSPSGHVKLVRGKQDDEFKPVGRNSAEYELLFADEELRSRMEAILHQEKPLPPDGLWIGDDRNAPPVDCGVQVNDGLAE